MVNVRSGKTVFIHKLPKTRSKATEDSANASPELTRNDRPMFNRNMTASIPRGATKGDSDHEGASTKQGRAPSNSQSDAIPVSDEQSSMVDKPGSGMRSPEVGRAGGDGVAPDAVGNTQASMDWRETAMSLANRRSPIDAAMLASLSITSPTADPARRSTVESPGLSIARQHQRNSGASSTARRRAGPTARCWQAWPMGFARR